MGNASQHIVSLSGGKDSTAMLLRLLETGVRVDAAVWFDGGWEFPGMVRHIDRLRENVPVEIVRVTTLDSRANDPDWGPYETFTDGLPQYDWPHAKRRWCTRDKINAVRTWERAHDVELTYIGYEAGEEHRAERDKASWHRYPLIDWGWTGRDCLRYCRDRGYDWEGLYDHFERVSCFCCPLQSLRTWRKLRRHYPELWEQVLHWDERCGGYLCHGRDAHQMEARFAAEDRQTCLWQFAEATSTTRSET